MRITLYMLRTGTKLQRSILRNGSDFKEINVAPPGDSSTTWKLFYKPTSSKPASWTDNIRSIVIDPNDRTDIKTQSSAAVLLVNVDSNLFAVTFGSGHFAVETNSIEAGFGLRVTANIVAKDSVTSADTKGLSQRARSQKTILPAADEFYALGIRPTEDWVRELSGKVSDKEFASTAAGADSLRLGIKGFSMRDLPEKLRRIAVCYDQEDYKQHFGFLDNFTRLNRRDPVVADLDQKLEALLLTQNHAITFAAPDPFAQLHVDHYRIKYRKHGDTSELDTAEVFTILDTLSKNDDPLHKIRVHALNESDEDVDRAHDLYDYIQVELDHGGYHYALNCGSWFRIAKDYLDEIESFIQALDDATHHLNLIPWNTSLLAEGRTINGKEERGEGLYNQLLAKANSWKVLDKKNVSYGQYRQIEICDILTPRRELLCVKSATSSSTLSHLFSQVNVSASLMHEDRYKAKVTDHLRELNPNAQYGRRDDWTFVYAIATPKPGRIADNLFFFSKINIVNSARSVQTLGYNVALAKIEMK